MYLVKLAHCHWFCDQKPNVFYERKFYNILHRHAMDANYTPMYFFFFFFPFLILAWHKNKLWFFFFFLSFYKLISNKLNIFLYGIMCIYVKSWYHANEMKSVDEQLLAHTPNDTQRDKKEIGSSSIWLFISKKQTMRWIQTNKTTETEVGSWGIKAKTYIYTIFIFFFLLSILLLFFSFC